MSSLFEKKTVLITGASGGIGEATAKEFARRGARVKLLARSEEKLEAICAGLRSEGHSARPFGGDVTDLSRMKQVVEEIEEEAPIDLLISNAGTYRPTELQSFSAIDSFAQMNLNFGGMLNVIQAVLPYMIQRRNGHIAAVASVVGYRGLPRAAAYGASKAAQINFLESLRFQARQHGIDVSIINPGFVKTPLTDKNDFPMPCLIEVDEAARQIFQGLARRKKEVHFPRTFSWAMKLARVMPFDWFDYIVRKKVLR